MSDVWEVLGVAEDADRDTVRRAYARKLRVTNPEDDPEGFKQLRAAYETVLEHLAWIERWGVAEDGEDEGDGPAIVLDEQQFKALLGQEVRLPVFRTEPVHEPLAPAPNDPRAGEMSALQAEREAERAQLHAAMRALDTAIRGTWRASDEELEALFNDVLSAPATGEIAVQAEVEAWSADLIAATIPRSDAILLQAVTRFGWSAESGRGHSYDIAACLARIDEWRLIEDLGRPRHPLNAAWRSLTRPPGGWLFWRIDALRPGLASGVETLLGRRGEVSPGLAFSFKPEAVARWERMLDRPHLTLTMLLAIPFAALLAYVVGTSLNSDRQAVGPTVAGQWAVLAAALVAPVLLFGLHALRYAGERRGIAGYARDGWAFGYLVLAALAPLLPLSPWSVAAFGGAALAVWAWMTATGTPATAADVGARLQGLWLSAVGLGAFGLVTLVATPVPAALVLTGMLLLYLLVRLGGWQDAIEHLRGSVARGPVLASVTVAAMYLPSLALILWWRGHPPAHVWSQASAMVLLGALPLPAALAGVERRGAHATARLLRAALFLVLIAGWFVTLAALPKPAQAPVPAPVVSVPLMNAPGTLRGTVVAAVGERDVDRALALLVDRQPGFAAIAEGNPALYGDLRSAIVLGVGGRTTPEQTADAVTVLLARSYRDRLGATTDSLMREEFAIRLARLRALQAESDGACVAPRWQFDELTLAEPVRQRQTAQALNVASNPVNAWRVPQVQAAPGQAEWDARAAAAAQVDAAAYRGDLAGARGAHHQCAAMMARLRVLTDDTAMRGELLRESMSAKPFE